MKRINPYNDESLKFNEKEQRYELTREFVVEEFGNPFVDDNILDRRIKKNSRVIYNYIYKVGNANNRKLVERMLNYTEEGRKYLKDALMSQIEADLETGINTLGNIPAINIKTGQVLDKSAMADGYLSQYTKDILESSVGYFGINILYQAPYPLLVINRYRSILK